MNNPTVPAPASCCCRRRPLLSHALAVALAAAVVAICHDHAFVFATTAGGGAPSVGAMRRLSFKHDAVRPALSSRLGLRRRIGNLSAMAAAREQISSASCVEAGGTTCGSDAKVPSSVPSYLLSVRGGGLDDDEYDGEYDEDSDYDFVRQGMRLSEEFGG